jgi:REP-associated tyrosine transposase
VLHELTRQKGGQIISGHIAKDHIHMCIDTPLKFAVSETIEYLKGKSTIAVARQFGGNQRNFSGENLGAHG